jgi:hypothetical protein
MSQPTPPPKKLIPAPKTPCQYTPIPASYAASTQGRVGRPWDGGACPVGLETRQPDLQEWYRLNRTLHKKRIVTGGHWSVL